MKHLTLLSFMAMSIGLFTYNTSAFAQQDDLEAVAGLGEEMTLFHEIPSVFGASKYEQKVTEAPSSVSIITSDEIKKYGYRTLGDILKSLRGFYMTNDHNYTYIGVRGFGRPGDYNTRVLILIDGHRENDSIYSSAYTDLSSTVDVDLIDRVEIIRGPSSSIYGTSAFLGVINVITKRGRDYQTVEGSAEAATYNTYKGRLSYGGRYENGAELLISGSHYSSDGEDWYYPEFDTPADNYGLAEGRDWEEDTNFFLKGSLGDFTFLGSYTYRKDGYPTAPWGTVFNDPNSETTEERGYLNLKYQNFFENNWGITARLFYDFYNYYGTYPFDYPPYTLNKDSANERSWGTELQVNKDIKTHKFIAGIEYRNYIRQDQANWDEYPFAEYLNDQRNLYVWAIYLQDEFKIYEKLILNAGIRYDKYETFGSSINPRLALIYTPIEKTNIKFLYGTAFRAPNVYELYYNDGGSTAKANPNLQPEDIDTFEVTLEQYLSTYYRLVTTGFYYKIENLIENIVDPSDGLSVFRNTSKVKSKGAEVELEGKWNNGVEARISYTYQDTEDDTTGQTLSNSPENMVKLNIIAPFIKERLFIGLELLYMDERLSVNNHTVDDSFVTNLTLFNNTLADGLELSFSVYNLFDEYYSDPGSLEHNQDAIEQHGRTCRFKLTYAF